MYIPRSFAESDADVLQAFIEAHPFGVMVTSAGGLFATHMPFLLQRDSGQGGVLTGHIARANEHHARVPAMSDVLVVFSGPDAHITPTWYPGKAESGKVVPTWNYVAVHVHGQLRFIDDPAFLWPHLERLTAQHESARGSAWTVNDPPPGYVDQQMHAIVGVEILVSRLEGKWKMSQNRSAQNVEGVIAGLRDSQAPMDAIVADIVDERRLRD